MVRPTVITPEVVHAAHDVLPTPDPGVTAIAGVPGAGPAMLDSTVLAYGSGL